MNKMGFGFLRLPKSGAEIDWQLVNDMTDRFMAEGGTYFDTCYTYLDGLSEEAIRKCVVERKPRSSFQLADKLPGYLCKSYADCQRYFEIELQRCGVNYFDVYMLHWLNSKHYQIAEQLEQFRFLHEKKAMGQARRIGFSYHDNAALLDEILTAHPEIDLVQLQINYLDWDSTGIESRKCYETCVKHGKAVIVMEPIKGGSLAEIPAEAMQTLCRIHPDWTAVDWALRFVQSLPQVEVCLSGMNTMAQIKQNMRSIDPLSGNETAQLLGICNVIHGSTAVPCTGCRYCETHCPQSIPIPDYFSLYNEITRYPQEDWKIIPSYQAFVGKHTPASCCIACRSCESHCPQGIKISEYMTAIAKRFE